jgi:hypothetical protein
MIVIAPAGKATEPIATIAQSVLHSRPTVQGLIALVLVIVERGPSTAGPLPPVTHDRGIFRISTALV